MGILTKIMHFLTSSGNIPARIAIAFWLFGLINNVLYVIILSAAVDLVPSNIPKGVVLLADIFPSFATKLFAPYFIHLIPYRTRILICATSSTWGMLLVAYTPSVPVKLCGIGFASLSSGLGELTFIGLTHFYGRISLAGFGSGTGAAGLVGSGIYAFATNTLRISSRTTIISSSVLPVIMVLCYFFILPKTATMSGYQRLNDNHSVSPSEEHAPHTPTRLDEALPSLNAQASSRAVQLSNVSNNHEGDVWSGLRANLKRVQKLVWPYMLPLFLVYVAEYSAISGVAPTLLFPLLSTPFHTLRDFYPAYNALYQAGVFISRSSILFLRINNIYLPSILQIVNFAVLTAHALLYFLPNVWTIFAIFFWAGLLGGAVYVNAFAKISDEVPEDER